MNQIEKYFNAEKYESLLFIAVGLTAISLAMYYLLKIKISFYNGMAYPFIAVAILQLIVGISVYFRSPKDIARVNKIVQTETSKIQTEEIPRMDKVMKNFVLYKWIEIALLFVGIIMFWSCQPASLLKGIGLGLAIQASFMLLLDFFAENRGKVYLEYLNLLT